MKVLLRYIILQLEALADSPTCLMIEMAILRTGPSHVVGMIMDRTRGQVVSSGVLTPAHGPSPTPSLMRDIIMFPGHQTPASAPSSLVDGTMREQVSWSNLTAAWSRGSA